MYYVRVCVCTLKPCKLIGRSKFDGNTVSFKDDLLCYKPEKKNSIGFLCNYWIYTEFLLIAILTLMSNYMKGKDHKTEIKYICIIKYYTHTKIKSIRYALSNLMKIIICLYLENQNKTT